MISHDIFTQAYDITNSYSIALNIFLVYTKNRNGCIIEKEAYGTKNIYDKLIIFLNKHFIIHLNVEFIPKLSILILANTFKNKYVNVMLNDNKNNSFLENIINFPCFNEGINNCKKYVYTIFFNKDIAENYLMSVKCKKKKDMTFKIITCNFQKSIDPLNLNFVIKYKKNIISTVKSITIKLENKKKLKKYEKNLLLSYFNENHLIYIIYCKNKLGLKIFKFKKMLLMFVYLCDLIKSKTINLNTFNKIFIFQIHILRIYFNYNFNYNIINSIAVNYLKNINVIINDSDFKLDNCEFDFKSDNYDQDFKSDNNNSDFKLDNLYNENLYNDKKT